MIFSLYFKLSVDIFFRCILSDIVDRDEISVDRPSWRPGRRRQSVFSVAYSHGVYCAVAADDICRRPRGVV